MCEGINKMLQEGMIEPRSNDWSNPILMIKKPNREYRFCSDFMKINKVTIKDNNNNGNFGCVELGKIYFKDNTRKYIGLATKLFSFFPIDDFSRLKLLFSIADFRPYIVFEIWRFIDYSAKKKFQVLLYIYCFTLIWNRDSRQSFLSQFTLLLPKR